MLAVRHQLFASKKADLNCGLLWCYSYRTGKGKQQNALWSNSLLACVRDSKEPGRENKRLQTWGSEADSVDVVVQTDLIKSHATVTGTLLSHSQRMHVLVGSKCSGVMRIAKQASVYCLAVILEVMHKKWSSAKKHLWKLEQLTPKNILPWLVWLR